MGCVLPNSTILDDAGHPGQFNTTLKYYSPTCPVINADISMKKKGAIIYPIPVKMA